jgi:ATP-binding cassette subfamily B protein
MKLVVTANAAERERGRFAEKNAAFIQALMRMRRLTYLSGGLPGLFLAAGSGAVLLYGGWRVIGGAITMGTLVAFVAYQMRLLGPIQGLMSLYASIATLRVSLRRVHEILDAPIEVVEPEHPVALAAGPAAGITGAVTFEAVSFSFGRGGPVLDGIYLQVEPGEVVAIVGPSGGGKSTMADLLVRQLDPDQGRILLDGHDLKTLRLTDLRRHVAVVEQEPFIFNATIAENVRYARPQATDQEVADAIRAAGLGSLVDNLPEGARTMVGERGRALSAGERQRVAIARALLADPAVLVLDEATASLDPATEADVIAGYEAVMRGRTTIIITHRPALARRADRVLVLAGGHLTPVRSPESVY